MNSQFKIYINEALNKLYTFAVINFIRRELIQDRGKWPLEHRFKLKLSSFFRFSLYTTCLLWTFSLKYHVQRMKYWLDIDNSVKLT